MMMIIIITINYDRKKHTQFYKLGFKRLLRCLLLDGLDFLFFC